MRSVIFIVFVSLFSCGFVLPETPAEQKAREKEERAWRESVAKAYDFEALRVFLASQIRSVSIVDGVDLRGSKVDEKWRFSDYGHGLSCGVWGFWTNDVKSVDFRLQWIYEEKKNGEGAILEKSVTLICRRESKSVFTLVRAERGEEENVILIP